MPAVEPHLLCTFQPSKNTETQQTGRTQPPCVCLTGSQRAQDRRARLTGTSLPVARFREVGRDRAVMDQGSPDATGGNRPETSKGKKGSGRSPGNEGAGNQGSGRCLCHVVWLCHMGWAKVLPVPGHPHAGALATPGPVLCLLRVGLESVHLRRLPSAPFTPIHGHGRLEEGRGGSHTPTLFLLWCPALTYRRGWVGWDMSPPGLVIVFLFGGWLN